MKIKRFTVVALGMAALALLAAANRSGCH